MIASVKEFLRITYSSNDWSLLLQGIFWNWNSKSTVTYTNIPPPPLCYSQSLFESAFKLFPALKFPKHQRHLVYIIDKLSKNTQTCIISKENIFLYSPMCKRACENRAADRRIQRKNYSASLSLHKQKIQDIQVTMVTSLLISK